MNSTTLKECYPPFTNWHPLSKEEVSQLPTHSGVYVFRRRTGEVFGRLAGFSDIVYIGKTTGKRGLRQRLYQYLNPGPTQWTNQRVNSFIEKYGIEFSYCLDNNPGAIELTLLRQYIHDHDELPPFNRISGRLLKMKLQDSIGLTDSLDIRLKRGR